MPGTRSAIIETGTSHTAALAAIVRRGAQAGETDVSTTERAVDAILAESFPASDPPPWTLGIVRPTTVVRLEHSRQGNRTDADARTTAMARVGVVETFQPSGGERTFVDGLISLAAACGIVLLVPVAILAVGAPIALFFRAVVGAIGWLAGVINP
jgi:hypothetical protein